MAPLASLIALFRHIDAVAVVGAVFFIKGYFVLFRFDDGFCLVTLAMPLEERVKAALHGPIVVFKPTMRRQDKVSLGAEAMPLKNSDLCRSDIDLRVLILPIGLELRRPRSAEPGDLGNDELSLGLQKPAPGGYPGLETHIIDGPLGPDHVEFPAVNGSASIEQLSVLILSATPWSFALD